MIYLNYLKPNIKTDICETKNYFGTTEGELRTQYNNHKKSVTHFIDQMYLEVKRQR